MSKLFSEVERNEFDFYHQLINKIAEEDARRMDELTIRLLKENNFEIDKLDEKSLQKLKEELFSRGVILDRIFFSRFLHEGDSYIYQSIIIPILDDIRRPMSIDEKKEILKEYCKAKGIELSDEDIQNGFGLRWI